MNSSLLNTRLAQNKLLVGLTPTERENFLSHMRWIAWQPGDVLREMGESVPWVVFPESGLLSCVLSARSCDVEIGIAGRSSAIDLAPALAETSAQSRTLGQIAGEGWQVSSEELRELFVRHPGFQRSVLAHLDERIRASSQYALCNRLHTAEERLARWLLQIADEVGTSEFELAPAFIAILLGTRLSAGEVALNTLWRGGIIERDRSRIIIHDHAYLEQCSCACYASLNSKRKSS